MIGKKWWEGARYARLCSVLVLSSVLWACGSDENEKGMNDRDAAADPGSDANTGDGDGDMMPSNQREIGTEGGMVALASGASIAVPAGALASPVELTIAATTAPSSDVAGGAVLGGAIVLGPEGQTFLKPVTVQVPFDATLVPAGFDLANVKLAIAPVGSTEFAFLETTVDLDRGLLSAETTHFSWVVPVAPSGPEPLMITTGSTSLPEGQVGVAYFSVTLAASGGTPPFTWSLASGSTLPAGLTLSAEGVLSGTPREAFKRDFTARVTDAAGVVLEKTFSLSIENPFNPQPVLTSISPQSVEQGASAFRLTVRGQNFVSGSVVNFAGSALTTTFVSTMELAAAVPTNLVETVGSVSVYVENPTPGGGSSGTTSFEITAAQQHPRPVLTGISPSTVLAGADDTQITITGLSLVNGTQVLLGGEGGQALATTYVSETQLTAVVPAANLVSADELSITLFTPAPGGGYSPESFTLTVGAPNPTPVLSSVSPASAGVNAASLTLTLTGSNFVSGAVAYFGTTALSTTYQSPTSLTASLPASLLTSEGSESVTVVNPSPGGGTSGSVTFTIQPSEGDLITSISRAEARAGSDDLTIRIQGGPFDPMSRVSIDDGATFLTVVLRYSTLIDFVLPKSALETAGTLNIVVEQGGVLSNPETFTVTDSGNSIPVLYAFTPGNVGRAPATAVSFSFTGTNFIPGTSQLWLGSTELTFYTTFGSATAGTLSMSQSNAAAIFPLAGDFEFRVVNPAPGGGASAPVQFAVTGTNPAPVILSISPTTVGTGTPELTFDIVIEAGSQHRTQLLVEKDSLRKERCDGYTFKNGDTICMAKLPATFFADPGEITFTLSTPAPGGGEDSVVVEVELGNPTPVRATPSLYQIPMGSGQTSVSLAGGPFVSTTTVLEANSSTQLEVTFVDAERIDVLVPSSLLASSGTLTLRATNPAPGGGTAPDATISVASGPQLSSLFTSPSPALAAEPFTLTLMGANLDLGDYRVVQFRSGEGEWNWLECNGQPEASSEMWLLSGCTIPSAGSYSARAFIEGLPASNELALTVE